MMKNLESLVKLISTISIIIFHLEVASSQPSTTHHFGLSSTSIKSNQKNEDVQSKGTDFAPKLVHQPQSVTIQPGKPHIVECAIEAEPEAEIAWFKDNQSLDSQPTHLEQQGGELMFFQMNEDDTGDYRCQATNYLGSISSEPFRLNVLPSPSPPIDNHIKPQPSPPTPDVQQNNSNKLIQDTVGLLLLLAKPAYLVGFFALIGLLVGLQLTHMRRGSVARRYSRHQHQPPTYGGSSCASSSGTGGSASSAESGLLGGKMQHGDPALSSLLSRTLAGSRKYRSYRDHMRKVAAVQENPMVSHTDLVDSYLEHLTLNNNHHQQQQRQQQQQQQHISFPQQQPQLHFPNLYNQSLAAREQARTLLQQSGQHLRSLSNQDNQPNIKQLSHSSWELSNNNNQHQSTAEQQQINHYSIIEEDNRSQLTEDELQRHHAATSEMLSSFPVASNDSRSRQQMRIHYPDQPSPYAVSSLCVSLQPSQQQQQQQQQVAAAPPVSSEAMRALSEQFDLNRIMLLDESNNLVLPPPRPPS